MQKQRFKKQVTEFKTKVSKTCTKYLFFFSYLERLGLERGRMEQEVQGDGWEKRGTQDKVNFPNQKEKKACSRNGQKNGGDSSYAALE